jgi:geranylgeranyl pyrophosphate synthase
VQQLFEAVEPSDDAVASVVAMAERYGGLTYARQRAEQWASEAEASLLAVPESPARDALLLAIAYAVERRR